ncbi:MAG: hypothetical protein ABF261_06995 [Candidatus Arcticimaribacter sp.]
MIHKSKVYSNDHEDGSRVTDARQLVYSNDHEDGSYVTDARQLFLPHKR